MELITSETRRIQDLNREQSAENKALRADINVVQQECEEYEMVIEEQNAQARQNERAKEDELDRLIRLKEEELARVRHENEQMERDSRRL